jgi:peptide/nickel transport system substrate-binding protein
MPRVFRPLVALALAALASLSLAQSVVVMQAADAATLDPTMNRETSTFNVLINVFDALLHKEADGSYGPGLASDWRALSDTVWEFDLRPGVTFHDGEPFTAESVAFTVARVQDEAVGSPIRSGFTFIESVEVVDPLQVRITTVRPTPLAEHYFSELMMVPPVHFERVGAEAFAQAPVGTGPYRVVSWQRDVAATLIANDAHWRGAPAVREVSFRPVPEAITRFASLSAGEADLVTQVPPSLVGSVEGAPGLGIRAVDGARAIYIGINTEESGHEALRDARVRQALNLAVDIEGIVEGIFGGLATPTTTLLTDLDFGHNDALAPYPYDPARARDLLAEAGYATGLSLVLGTPNGRYVNDVQVAQAVAEQLQAVGITIDLQVSEYGAYVGQLFSGNAPDLYLIGWGNAPLDADFILYPLLHSTGFLSYVADPELDALLDAGRSTVDRQARLDAYEAATAWIHEQAYMIFLYKPQDLYGVVDDLDWTPRSDERIWLFAASPR